jgi:hypothetical protein
MPEQRINHQLPHRIRHLEHNLRDITARCNTEHERLHFYLTPTLKLRSHI